MHRVGSNAGKYRQQMWWIRATRFTVLFSFVGLVGVLGSFVKLPLLVLEPGPAPDVAKRTRISAQTYPSDGSIHLTTAQVRSPEGATAKDVLLAIFNPDKVVFPRESIYPADESHEHTESIQAAQMTQSELEAAVAALSELGMPYQEEGVFVSEIAESSPAARRLIAGDVITSVDGKPVTLLKDLTQELEKLPAGSSVRLEVTRGEKKEAFTVKTAKARGESKGSSLGAELVQYRKAPVDVSISSRDIGGPSAGLIYALSIYDRLVPDDITGGRTIAGTGTIENTEKRIGVVGAVGSVNLKVKGADRIGADVFLVPKAELEEARKVAGSDMEVIGVSSLKEAIAELEKLPATNIAQKKKSA
ncbi:MAG TPA: PDZ domain-containing protein [Actinomycetota bacterium]|nr:PDZ domain-containing protein [Actinomycetota bacterium]